MSSTRFLIKEVTSLQVGLDSKTVKVDDIIKVTMDIKEKRIQNGFLCLSIHKLSKKKWPLCQTFMED